LFQRKKNSFILNSDEGEFEESVSQLKFYKEYEDSLEPPDGILDNQFKLQPSPINLVVLATDSPAIVFQVTYLQGYLRSMQIHN
jgi:hypothetical protein